MPSIFSQLLSRLFLTSAIAACALGILSPLSFVQAELNFRVGSGGQFQPLPIAVTSFSGEGETGAKIAGIISANLKRSGYFSPLDKAQFPEKDLTFDATPNFAAWQSANVQALVTGRVTREASGRLKVEFRLWDVLAGKQNVGHQYFTEANNWRRISHIVSDSIYTKITGIGGYFDTRIVFVDESGPKETRRKRLAVMDQDGANVRYLTKGEEIVITPRYSPVAQDVAYMAQRIGEQPRVNVLGIDSGQVQSVGNFPDMSSSPRFSPDGGKIALSLQQGGNANLYSVDLRSRMTTRLTSTSAIDTSPAFSPDGSQIVFESDRGGSQQLYVMSASGGEAKRLSFGQGSYAQPAWSPRGDFIAFTKRTGGGFGIGIMKADGSGERILTEGYHNESPSWSPNGQYIVFYRDPGGQSGGRLYMVDITGRVEAPIPTPGFAADPAWSPLLTETR
jgi:TolB protein